MRALALVVCAFLGACFSERTNYTSGELACSSVGHECPSGLYCAGNDRCYRDGEAPMDAPLAFDARVLDAPRPVDGAVGGPLDGPVGPSPDGPSPLPDAPCVMTSCPANACGSYPNGCDGFRFCGDCANNLKCDVGLCRDKTVDEACVGLACGTVMTGTMTYTCPPGCTPPASCNGAGVPNQCGCTPTVSSCPMGANCGVVDNGCGTPIRCGPRHLRRHRRHLRRRRHRQRVWLHRRRPRLRRRTVQHRGHQLRRRGVVGADLCRVPAVHRQRLRRS